MIPGYTISRYLLHDSLVLFDTLVDFTYSSTLVYDTLVYDTRVYDTRAYDIPVPVA